MFGVPSPRGRGRGQASRCAPNPSSSEVVSQAPSIHANSPTAGSDAAGPNNSKAPAWPWDPKPPEPLLPLVVGDVSSAFGMRST